MSRAIRKVNESRDILLIDQRGTGQSNALKCPQIKLEDALSQDWDDLARVTRECLESLDGDPRVARQKVQNGKLALEWGSQNSTKLQR